MKLDKVILLFLFSFLEIPISFRFYSRSIIPDIGGKQKYEYLQKSP